jgi:hypothetical protein
VIFSAVARLLHTLIYFGVVATKLRSFACTPSNSSDCKRQPSKRHILTDSGTDRMSQRGNVVERFALVMIRRFLANARLQSGLLDSVQLRPQAHKSGVIQGSVDPEIRALGRVVTANWKSLGGYSLEAQISDLIPSLWKFSPNFDQSNHVAKE